MDTRRRQPRARGCALALALAAALTPTAHADDGSRRAGDALSYALPVGVLGTELLRGERDGAWQFTRSIVVTGAVTELLKRTVHSERPDHTNDQSFPSGHAARAFAAATYVHRRYGWDHAWPLYALSLYVGHTRVQAERHRWADVAGAAAIAAASSWWLVTPRQQPLSVDAQPRARGVAVTFVLQWP
jgi:membrane-associated phospholipid phosphatase